MGATKTVLVAEDDPNDSFLLGRAFTKVNAAVKLHFVGDGHEAIEYLKGEAKFSDRLAHPFPDLVLLDHKMPRLNGAAVLQWIRRQPNLSSLPVIILSSSNLKPDIDQAYRFGADSYMVKPHELRKLCEMIAVLNRRWLEAGQDTGSAEGLEGGQRQ